MAGKRLVGTAVAVFGLAAFAAGWIRGHTRGFRYALGEVRRLRRHAECRGPEGSEWVYPEGHPRAGEPFAEGADEPPRGGVGPDWREYGFRHHRPFRGMPLLETIEFDIAERLPRRHLPPDLPPWWERPEGHGYRELEADLWREHERARKQMAALRRLRRGAFGGLRVGARMRGAPEAASNPLLTVRVENTALAPREVSALYLTYRYQNPLVEALFGATAPEVLLTDLSREEDPPRTVPAGDSLVWFKELGEMADLLEDGGMRLWPDFGLMALDDPLSERLADSGRLGLGIVNLLRTLASRYLAVMVVDGRGVRRKVEVRSEPPWVEDQEDAT